MTQSCAYPFPEPDTRARCFVHDYPLGGDDDGECLLCIAQALFTARDHADGTTEPRDDWWEFRAWLEDEACDAAAIDHLIEKLKTHPGDELLRWRYETGAPAERKALGELLDAMKVIVEPLTIAVRRCAHCKETMGVAYWRGKQAHYEPDGSVKEWTETAGICTECFAKWTEEHPRI